ncbi:unnamed protein product [Moneuplotes crassus]|uniref:C2H2-type domain-containing protein n=1 Tax=Euplotes crassus TaxID=5936 RepID=A0AAD1ULC2_EUPCR|nr:unnamed protein product [Moneuplotes crassus]
MSSGRLYKLKFFCSLCQKQLKDDNGYKCHLRSDSHKKMMGTYMTNPEKLLDTFSKEFESGFLEVLKTRHPKTAVMANTVYQELIKDQYHVHMNSTKWSSLGDFVKYLEKANICEVEWSESKPVIKYLDKNAREVKRESEYDKKIKKRQREADREERRLKNLGEMAQKELERSKKREVKDQQKDLEEEKEKNASTVLPGQAPAAPQISFNLNLFQAQKTQPKPAVVNLLDQKPLEVTQNESKEQSQPKIKKKPRGNLDMLLEMVNRDKKYQEGKPIESYKRPKQDQPAPELPSSSKDGKKEFPWLCKGVVVKVMQKELGGGKFYKQKGKVYKVVEPKTINSQEFSYIANVKMITGPAEGTKIRIDQVNLEPVAPIVPQEGEKPKVMILKGKFKGITGTLNETNASEQVGIVEIGENDLLKLGYDCFTEFYSRK